MKKVKQITYLMAIIMVVGSTVGAGIFFKNGSIFSNVGGSLGLMITSWIVAAIGVMALGLALVEMSSAVKSDGGMLEWARKFMPKKISKMSAGYMLLVYLPINYIAMPLYIVNTFQDALQSLDGNLILNGWLVGFIAFAFFAFAATLDRVAHSASEKMQILISWVKFIPLLIVIVFSIYVTSSHGIKTDITASHGQSTSLTAYSPALGVLASIPAILFAFDGFYTVTSLKSDMKDESKIGPVIAIGVALVSTCYILFGILTGISGEKNFTHIMAGHEYWLYATNILIMIAVFAILNAFALVTYRFYENVYSEQPLGLVGLVGKITRTTNHKKAAFRTSIGMACLFYLAFIPAGIYGFNEGDYTGYGSGSGNLYCMADMLTNYTSLMAFVIIAGAIAGALINRKTNKVEVEKRSYFVPCAWIAIIFCSLATIYMIANNIAGMTGLNGADQKTEVTKFVILVVTLAISVLPIIIPNKYVKKLQLEK